MLNSLFIGLETPYLLDTPTLEIELLKASFIFEELSYWLLTSKGMHPHQERLLSMFVKLPESLTPSNAPYSAPTIVVLFPDIIPFEIMPPTNFKTQFNGIDIVCPCKSKLYLIS